MTRGDAGAALPGELHGESAPARASQRGTHGENDGTTGWMCAVLTSVDARLFAAPASCAPNSRASASRVYDIVMLRLRSSPATLLLPSAAVGAYVGSGCARGCGRVVAPSAGHAESARMCWIFSHSTRRASATAPTQRAFSAALAVITTRLTRVAGGRSTGAVALCPFATGSATVSTKHRAASASDIVSGAWSLTSTLTSGHMSL